MACGRGKKPLNSVRNTVNPVQWINIVCPTFLFRSNVLCLVMGHPLVMGHYFDILKSMKIYYHQLTIASKKLILRGLKVLHLLIMYMKKKLTK